MAHTESHKDERAEEKVVEKDETKIVQNQIGKSRSLVNKLLKCFEHSNFRGTTIRSGQLIGAVIGPRDEPILGMAEHPVQRNWLNENFS